jgi:hypothetical protein
MFHERAADLAGFFPPVKTLLCKALACLDLATS